MTFGKPADQRNPPLEAIGIEDAQTAKLNWFGAARSSGKRQKHCAKPTPNHRSSTEFRIS
jgi:hypothetical protein